MTAISSTNLDVTVVIPTRNRSALVGRCLRAALAQEGVRFEVIVVDDASTDATAEVVAAHDDARVRLISLDERHGVSRARNIGIAHASGEWLAFLDDDDLWAPWKLRRQLDAAHEQGGDFVYGAAVVIDDNNTIVRFGRPPGPTGLHEVLFRKNVIPGGCSNVVARTELVRSVGEFDPALAQLADRDLWIRLAEASRPAACESLVVAYRLHDGNMRCQPDLDGTGELEYLIEKHGALRDRDAIHQSRVSGYRYFARAQLRVGRRLPAASIFAALARKERRADDLGRALAALVFGGTPPGLVRPFRPRLSETAAEEIDWLRQRPRHEIDWLWELTLTRIDPPPASADAYPLDGGDRPLVARVG